jgi:hypothetical protein
MPFLSKLTPFRQQRIATSASIFIGACTGPFLFKAAGLIDFPKWQVSHWVIAICYVMGMRTISQFILLRIFSFLSPPAK